MGWKHKVVSRMGDFYFSNIRSLEDLNWNKVHFEKFPGKYFLPFSDLNKTSEGSTRKC